MAKKKCKICKAKLENLIVKSLQMNVPDGVRGRDICPHCNKGCILYDVPIFHNDFEQQNYAKSDEQKYGVCCSCGQRGDRRLWVKPTEETPPISSCEDMLAEYKDASEEAIEFAEALLGHNPFEDKPEEPPLSMEEIDAEVKTYRLEQKDKKGKK